MPYCLSLVVRIQVPLQHVFGKLVQDDLIGKNSMSRRDSYNAINKRYISHEPLADYLCRQAAVTNTVDES